MTEKLVKVKVVTPYKDKQKMLLFDKVGEVHEVSESRAKELISKGLVELVDKSKLNKSEDDIK